MNKYKQITWWMNLLNWVYKTQYKNNKIAVKDIMSIVYDKYDDGDDDYSFFLTIESLGITKIDVYRTSNTLYVWIYLYRPGLLIGKRGKDFDNLKERLEYAFGSKVVIHIEEISFRKHI